MIPLIRLQWQTCGLVLIPCIVVNVLFFFFFFFNEIRKLFCARDAHGSYFKPLTFTLVKGTG